MHTQTPIVARSFPRPKPAKVYPHPMSVAESVPAAPREEFIRDFHGDRVPDPFHWMSDKNDPRLLAYLTAENEFTAHVTASQSALAEEVYNDLATRTKQTDLSVPLFVTHVNGRSYWYYARMIEGKNYPVHCRVPAQNRSDVPDVTLSHPDEMTLLDVNALAEGHEFLSLGWSEMSPDGTMLAYSVDTTGDERYDLYVLDVETSTIIEGPIEGIASDGTWIGCQMYAYMRLDDAWRPFEVWRHALGTDPAGDVMIFTEPDERFWVGLDGSRDHAYALIEVESKTASETYLIPTDAPTTPPRCVSPRREGIEYSVEVAPDALYITHNAHHPQFSLAVAPLTASDPSAWREVLPGQDNRRLLSVSAYPDCLVLAHRTDGAARVSLLKRDATGDFARLEDITFDEEIYDVDAEADPDIASDRIRLSFESMITPPTIIEYRITTGERRILKRAPVLDHPVHGPYDPDAYVQALIWATAPDGTRIPVSLVHRADIPLDGSAPAVLYGYGAYEISSNPFFSISRLSLLNRGFVYAIAHVRGGGECGRPWYDNGKLVHKRNTFTDFIACAEALIAQGYTASDRLIAEGGSAGGLLMGAIVNMAPDLFAGVHAAVPFVDPLTTMLNPDLPLTVTEWEEWGDPLHDESVYWYMKSYAPYDGVAAVKHPRLLVTTGLNDTRVEVTEPAKWVAKLRMMSVNEPDFILLRTEFEAGHAGGSARYQAWKDRAFELAWIIACASPDAG